MAANPFFSGRIPVELNKAIENYIEKTGESKTQILINALSKYLEFPLELPAKKKEISYEEFIDLVERVAAIEEKLANNNAIIITNNNVNEIMEVINTETKTDDNNEENIVIINDNNANETNLSNSINIIGPLPESEMANFIGINRGTLRNYRKKLEKDNKPFNTPQNFKSKINELSYCLECQGEEKTANGKKGIMWIAKLVS